MVFGLRYPLRSPERNDIGRFRQLLLQPVPALRLAGLRCEPYNPNKRGGGAVGGSELGCVIFPCGLQGVLYGTLYVPSKI